MKYLKYVLTVVFAAAIVFFSVCIRDGKLPGYMAGDDADIVVRGDDGTVSVMSGPLVDGVAGYAGPTPVKVVVRNGVVEDVQPLENSETARYFRRAAAVLDSYRGVEVHEAENLEPDAVSGATMSSESLKKNVRAALEYYNGHLVSRKFSFDPSLSDWAVLAVILTGVIIPVFFRNRYMRILQLVMNVAVLGFWGHTFLSFGTFMGWASGGVDFSTLSLPFLIFLIILVMPFFNRKEHYCMWYCPMGSAQELLGMVLPSGMKLHVSAKAAKIIDRVRESLFILLMVLMWTSVWADWIDYEAFSFFLIKDAGWIVIVLASLFLFLSLFIQRPYCRMVCPTGTLLKISQGNVSFFRKRH